MAANDILIGLGNPIMSDDGIGLVVSRRVHELLPGSELEMSTAGGFDVVDLIVGYRRAVIIDSMVSGRYPPGTVVRLESGSALRTLRTGHSHGINFLDAIDVARSCNAAVPAEVTVYGIEVKDPYTIGQEVSETLKESAEGIAREIAEDLLAGR